MKLLSQKVDILHEAVNIFPKNKKWACRHIFMSNNGALVAQAIKDKMAIAVSDGSLKHGMGTAAFTVVSATVIALHPILLWHPNTLTAVNCPVFTVLLPLSNASWRDI